MKAEGGRRKAEGALKAGGQQVDLSRWAFVALGSNLGDSAQTIRSAMDRLQELSEQPLLRSSLWRSSPVDCPPGSPDFINAAVGLLPSPDETPESLLRSLQALEEQFGRLPKTILNEPRVLDLDLIAFGGETRDTPELILPHPRARVRQFVLAPLAELAPELVLPRHTSTMRDLLQGLGSHGGAAILQ